MSADTKRYLDEAATARFLNFSQRTLQRMRAEGGGPAFIRAGARRVLYDVTEIERWAAARTFPHRAAELAQIAA
jgi:predicted DNA-binding transcriptional regulator AlpA